MSQKNRKAWASPPEPKTRLSGSSPEDTVTGYSINGPGSRYIHAAATVLTRLQQEAEGRTR